MSRLHEDGLRGITAHESKHVRDLLAELDAERALSAELASALEALQYEGEDAEGLATCVAWPKPSWVRDLIAKARGERGAK